MADLRQTNFLGGELAPTLWGRTDLELYGKGLRLARNFFVSKQGSLVSRPGTRYVCKVKATGQPGGVRLVPFVFSDDTSFALEFGHLYVRFVQNGAQVLSGGVPLEVVTPYRWDDLPNLRFAQSGNVLTIVDGRNMPQELERHSDGTWSCTDVSFNLIPTRFVDIAAGTGTAEPMLVNDSGRLFFIDDAHPTREWVWLTTAIVKERRTGYRYETAAVQVTKHFDGGTPGTATPLPSDNKVVLALDAPVTIRRLATPPGTSYGDDYEVVTYLYYRGRGGLFGLVGASKTMEFVDRGEEPRYDVQPPIGTNPFATSIKTFSLTGKLERPLTVGYFQNRRVYGGSTFRPATVLLSALDSYDNFDVHDIVPVPGESLEFTIALRTLEKIRGVLALQKLLLFTNATVWSFSADQGLETDTLPAFKVEDEVGAANLQPIIVEGAALWVRSKGRGVRALVPNGGAFQPRDVSAHAQHLFQGGEGAIDRTLPPARKVVDLAYAEDPWSLVFAVREDGVLLTLQFSPGGAQAWTQHLLPGGAVRAVCAVPEDAEDEVYVVVERPFGTCIERLASRVTTDSADDGMCLDCGVTVTQDQGVDYSKTVTGLGHLEGQQVYAVGQGLPPVGPFVVSGGAITLPLLCPINATDDHGSQLARFHVGLLFECDVGLLSARGGGFTDKMKTVTGLAFEVDNSKGVWFGQDENHLEEFQQRQVSDSYGTPSAANELVVVRFGNDWDRDARAHLKQKLPLPVTILGITRELEGGGR